MARSISINQSVCVFLGQIILINISLSLLIPELKHILPGEQGIISKALRKRMVQHCEEVGGSKEIRRGMGNEGWSDVQDRSGIRKTSEKTWISFTKMMTISTRMHSSRMGTACSLPYGGLCQGSPWHTPPGQRPPGQRSLGQRPQTETPWKGLFWLLQIPFAFEFECTWLNDLCMAKLSFSCSEISAPFYLKQLNGNLARHFKIKNIYIFECLWLDGNLNDVCTYSAIHTWTQMQMETEGYRMHLERDTPLPEGKWD